MNKRADFPCPMVMRRFKSYESPVTGEKIVSRKQRSKDLEVHDCVPTQDVKVKPGKERTRHAAGTE